MKTKFRILAALLALSLCLGLAACGAETPAAPAPSEAEAAPAEAAADTAPAEAPAEPEPTEPPVSLPGLSWPVEEAEGPTAVSYPYIVRTETAVWHLSKDDMELLGEEAYLEGLERILRDQDADFAEAQALLAPWLQEEVPPIDIYTDFCGHAEGDEIFGAFYRGTNRDIRLFHSWDIAAMALLHEYVHYLTFSCTDKPVSMGLFAEGIAEYVSQFACRNRMLRTASREGMSEDDKRLAGEWNLLDEDGCLDPERRHLYLAEETKSPEGTGMKYSTITNAVMTRDERINQNPTPTTISYYEAGSMIAYLVETYGEEQVFGRWDMDPLDLADAFGKGFPELYRDWEVWNRAKCEELGIVLDFSMVGAEEKR